MLLLSPLLVSLLPPAIERPRLLLLLLPVLLPPLPAVPLIRLMFLRSTPPAAPGLRGRGRLAEADR